MTFHLESPKRVRVKLFLTRLKSENISEWFVLFTLVKIGLERSRVLVNLFSDSFSKSEKIAE
jgi:hypothetical protein